MSVDAGISPAGDEDADELLAAEGTSGWRSWYLSGVLLALVAFCLGPSLVGMRTLFASTRLTLYFPWVSLHGSLVQGQELCSGDTVDSVLPGIAHVRDALYSGHLSSWQSLVSGGGPLSSVPDQGLLDPLSLPYFILPLWLAPAVVVLLSWVVGVGGTFLFLRRLSLSRPASMLAGLIFVTSGFMVMWTNWPQTRTAALVPALFWAVERLVQRVRLVDAALVAAVVASMIFGGFPQVTGLALYLAAAWFVVRVVILHRTRLRDGARSVVYAALGLGFGVAVTAVQLLPFVNFYRTTNLAYRTGDAKDGLPFNSLATLVAPNTYGLCVLGHPTHGNVSPIESVAYVGAAAMVLAVAGAAFGLARRRALTRGTRGFFLASAVIITAIGWASPSLRDFVARFPVFNGNPIGRIRILQGFALAMLAAIGFDHLTQRRGRPERARGVHRRSTQAGGGLASRVRGADLWAVLVWVGAAGFGIAVVVTVRHYIDRAGIAHSVERALWVPAVLVGVALVAVVVGLAGGRRGRTAAFVVLPLLVAAQGAQFFHTVLPGDSRSSFYPVTAAGQFLKANLGQDRFTSSDNTMYPATGLYYGLRTPTGHAFTEPQWTSLLRAVDPTVMESPTYSEFSRLDSSNAGHQPILDRMGVKYFVAPPSDLDGTLEPLPPISGTTVVGATGAECTMPEQPVRGIAFALRGPATAAVGGPGVTFDVALQAGTQTIESGRYVGSAGVGTLVVALAGEDLPRGGTMRITVRPLHTAGPVAMSSSGEQLACSAVTPVDDGLQLVHADPGSIIYQRLDALNRIRWASGSIVIPSSTARVAALAKGVPDQDVVLDAAGPAASGRPARITPRQDSGDVISLDVAAEGSGYLVVADAMQQSGWSATVDGHGVKILPADDAMVAVPVPAGTHHVTFRYNAPGQKLGAGLTGVSLLLVVAGAIWDWRRHRRPQGDDPSV